MKSEQNFRVTYDGPALQAHTMDVRELAPAILAMADLIKAANEELHGDKAEVRIAVKAGFREGSFGIDMVFFQDVLTQITELFSGKEASASANAIQILSGLGLFGGGLIGFLRWLKNRKIERIDQRDNKATIYTADESIEVDLVTMRLLKNRRVRLELKNVLRPLEADGIDSFCTSSSSSTGELICKDELPLFQPPADSELPLSDSTANGILLKIESAVFKDGNKWRFTDGSRSFYATIEDSDFMSRIESGEERFGKADVLLVDLRQIQFAIDGELKSEYRITRVLEHRAPLQKPLI
ncbi:MAG: hypothetical protein RIR18_382 [Pseudomonadota bacterium]